MKHWSVRLIVCAMLLSLAWVCLAAPVKKPRPLVVAVYYTWYGTPFGAHGSYRCWSNKEIGKNRPNGCDASIILYPPAIREINSSAYPLIGPYDSMNKEVVRWHIRLAKAAGIDAFLVDWWEDAGWQQRPGWTKDVFEKSVLPVAEEENFKVALFDETPQFVKNPDLCKDRFVYYINKYKNSPAYLKIDGKPVYAIYQVTKGTLSPEKTSEFIDYTEQRTGPVYWIADWMRGYPKGKEVVGLKTPEEYLALPKLNCIMGYCMWGVWSYDELLTRFKEWADQTHAGGKKVMVPISPGLDNSSKRTNSKVIPRQHGDTLRAYWKAAIDAGADMICITSWNEWPETTVIEPAVTWADPYLYLRIIAEKQGKVFVAPPLPSSENIDPAMAEHLNDIKRDHEQIQPSLNIKGE